MRRSRTFANGRGAVPIAVTGKRDRGGTTTTKHTKGVPLTLRSWSAEPRSPVWSEKAMGPRRGMGPRLSRVRSGGTETGTTTANPPHAVAVATRAVAHDTAPAVTARGALTRYDTLHLSNSFCLWNWVIA